MKVLSYDLLTAFASLFVGNREHYAVQQGNSSYWRMCEPLTLNLVACSFGGPWVLPYSMVDNSAALETT